jgi:transcriptional regulator with XRE-family HTH domain
MDQSASPAHTDREHAPGQEPVQPEGRWRDLLGKQLRERRHARGETLEAVAGRANVSMPYLSEVERGLKEPSSEVVAAIGAALETTLLDLVEAVAERLREDRATASTSTSRGDFTLAA